MQKTMMWMMICGGLLSSAASAADGGEKAISPASITEARVFNVLKYGAVGDDKTDNTGNLGTGDINYWVVEGNVGAVEKFTRNGGAAIKVRRIGEKPSR